MRLDAALEAAEDGHVAGLQVRRASWREEAQHDVRERRPHGSQRGLAGVDAGHVPAGSRSMLKATVNVVASLVLPCSCCLTPRRPPPDLMHRQEPVRRLAAVHDVVCVCAHQPAQLDEEPVRVGVLLLRAVELFHALGRLVA